MQAVPRARLRIGLQNLVLGGIALRLKAGLPTMLLAGLLTVGGVVGCNRAWNTKVQSRVPDAGLVQVREGEMIIFREFAVFRSIREMTREADLVVIGTVQSKDGSRNLARNPLNPNEEAVDRKLMSQEYQFGVEQALKGVVNGEVLIVYPEYTELPNGDRGHEPQVPLDTGERYVLFLRQGTDRTYHGVGEPWLFRLSSGKAQAMSVLTVSPALTGLEQTELIRLIEKLSR